MEILFWDLLDEAALRIGTVVPECIPLMGTRDIEFGLGTSDRYVHETAFLLEGTPIDERA
jgi:hypothetical protein